MKLFHTTRRNRKPCSDYEELTTQPGKSHLSNVYLLQDFVKCLLFKTGKHLVSYVSFHLCHAHQQNGLADQLASAYFIMILSTAHSIYQIYNLIQLNLIFHLS